MSFNSLQFLIFYPIVLLLYFILPQKVRWMILLPASLYFYMSWNPALIVLIMFTTVVSYVTALLVARTEKKGMKRFWMLVSVVASLAVLFVFKYLNFFTTSIFSIMGIFGSTATAPVFNLILPVGISFYTFQTLSYTVDVYRGSIQPEKHFGYYALFVSFFPQLVAGPIERPENLLPQFKEKHKLTWENLSGGGKKMLIGFFKKVVVADTISVYVNSVFNKPDEANGFAVLIAAMLFAVQIYCDFAGYTDIAIGCAEIMGIKLMKNFDRPYSATTIKEFWGRWHISLSTWLRDYIYFPLGGSRCKKWKCFLNIFIVFFLSGLWHGAAWTFVLWGILHGVYRIIGELLKKPAGKLTEKCASNRFASGLLHAVRVIRTFIIVDFAWIFFRANSISDLGTLLGKLFTDWKPGFFDSGIASLSLNFEGAVFSILAIFALWLIDSHLLDNRKDEKTPALAVVRYAMIIFTIVFAWGLLWAGSGSSSFIYFQF